MFVRGGTGAHNSQDQNLLSTKFSPLPLPIKEEREETRKRRIGETTTQRFVEASIFFFFKALRHASISSTHFLT